MARVVHVIGNGDQASLYQREQRKGVKLACNQTPFEIPDKYATCIVDFKFMNALTTRNLHVSGNWILGFRPQRWMQDHPTFYMEKAQQVKEFYTHLPKYAWNKAKGEDMGMGYTAFSCGHMAVHYAMNRLKADEVHMYGFDSLLDFNMNSFSDLVLHSDRGQTNNHRLSSNWRPVWEGMFKEFKDRKFVLHHNHDQVKVNHPGNVEVVVYGKEVQKPTDLLNFDNISDA